jgi:hypothetical protein
MSSDVWASSTSAPSPADPQLPRVMDVLGDTFEDFQGHVGPYFLSGIGVFVVVTPLLLVTIGVLTLVAVGSIFSGAALENEAVVGLGGAVVYGGLLGMMLAVSFVVTPPLQASVGRAVLRRITTGDALGFSDAFSTWRQDFGRVVVTYAVVHLLILTGTLFCYVPGILMAVLLGFAVPSVVVHRLSPVEAIRLSVSHALREPGWHLGYFGVAIAISLFLAYIPVLGFALTITFLQAFQIRCYVHIFGTEDHPRDVVT